MMVVRSGPGMQPGDEWLRSLAEIPGGPVILLHDMNDSGRIVYANEAACRHFGVDRSTLLGWRPQDYDPSSSAAEVGAADGQAVRAGGHRFETLHRRANGELVPVEVLLAHVDGAQGTWLVSMVFDISERKQTAERLQQARLEQVRLESDARCQQLFANFDDSILFIDVEADWQMRVAAINPAAERGFGLRSEAVAGCPVQEALSPALSGFLLGLDRRRLERAHTLQEEVWLREAGRERCFSASMIPLSGSQGSAWRIAVILRDITRAKAMERSLAAREREYRVLVENNPDHIARYDQQCRRIYVNAALGEKAAGGTSVMLGLRPCEFPGGANAERFEQTIRSVFADGADREIEFTWPAHDGEEACSLVRLTAERNGSGEIVSVLGVGRDITELNVQRQRIHQMAYYDSLTGLPNRVLFAERLQHALEQAAAHDYRVALMILDVDRFKSVNDSLGHPAGDALLRAVAQRLLRMARASDVVARLGGDEFAILQFWLEADDDPAVSAGELLHAFQESVVIGDREMVASVSIGVTVYPQDSNNADDLLKFADAAMYHAKRSGRNSFSFYARKLTETARDEWLLEADLRKAVSRGELELYFQPKLRLADGALMGSEALLRWNHPERGLLPPGYFIPLAEETGLIFEVGEWVLHQACRVAREWNAASPGGHRMAINLSARQFQLPDLVDRLRRILENTGCEPEWIELEITESLLLDETSNVLQALLTFRDMGIGIAIDDFGTGYSALNYLARYPITTLKIDRSFISQMCEQASHAELVKAMLSIARCLGQVVVAEGVETVEQAEFLKSHGCDMAQGYLYGRPMPRTDFEQTGLLQ